MCGKNLPRERPPNNAGELMPFAKSPWKLAATALVLLAAGEARAAITRARTITADVVALDQPIMFNPPGAAHVNGMMDALRRAGSNKTTRKPLTRDPPGAGPGQA